MGKLKHLNKKKVEAVNDRLWQVESGLKGLGSLFKNQSRHASYSQDELFGLGQLLQHLSYELSVLEDVLHCGYDSKAMKK